MWEATGAMVTGRPGRNFSNRLRTMYLIMAPHLALLMPDCFQNIFCSSQQPKWPLFLACPSYRGHDHFRPNNAHLYFSLPGSNTYLPNLQALRLPRMHQAQTLLSSSLWGLTSRALDRKHYTYYLYVILDYGCRRFFRYLPTCLFDMPLKFFRYNRLLFRLN